MQLRISLAFYFLKTRSTADKNSKIDREKVFLRFSKELKLKSPPKSAQNFQNLISLFAPATKKKTKNKSSMKQFFYVPLSTLLRPASPCYCYFFILIIIPISKSTSHLFLIPLNGHKCYSIPFHLA